MPSRERNIAELEKQSAAPDFWQDPLRAQKVMKELTARQDEIRQWKALQKRIRDALDLLDLAIQENHTDLAPEIAAEAAAIEKELNALEINLLFSGEYDRNNAVLSIHAGAGGTEAQDWAQMLLRLYLRWAEGHGYQTEILEETPGEEAGLKSVTVEIKGPFAYGRLKSERGVHRLVRLSPFDANHRRHTSFALVEVMPELEEDTTVEINPDDVRVDIYHASGHGGQNVQKVATAVRLTHIPTGIVVTCQNERSQLQNKERAWQVLRARLLEKKIEEQEAERARLKGKHVEAGWGNAIRSYVLHPYQLVKDNRSGYETSRTDLVLDGEIDPLIEAYLKTQVS